MNERADGTELAAVVRARRSELGLTQQQLADLAEVSTRFVHMLEAGKPTVQLASVQKVLAVLGLRLVVDDAPGEREAST